MPHRYSLAATEALFNVKAEGGDTIHHKVIIRPHPRIMPELHAREMLIQPPVKQEVAKRIAELTGAVIHELSVEQDGAEYTKTSLGPELRDVTEDKIIAGVHAAVSEFGHSAGPVIQAIEPVESYEAACRRAEDAVQHAA